jgi:hypothetical protein
MAGIGDERERVGSLPIEKLGNHKPKIERNANRKGSPVVCWGMRMAVFMCH